MFLPTPEATAAWFRKARPARGGLKELVGTAAATANVRIDRAYAHSAYLEDVAVARRADPARPASLVYQVRGALRRFSVGVFDAAVAPR